MSFHPGFEGIIRGCEERRRPCVSQSAKDTTSQEHRAQQETLLVSILVRPAADLSVYDCETSLTDSPAKDNRLMPISYLPILFGMPVLTRRTCHEGELIGQPDATMCWERRLDMFSLQGMQARAYDVDSWHLHRVQYSGLNIAQVKRFAFCLPLMCAARARQSPVGLS